MRNDSAPERVPENTLIDQAASESAETLRMRRLFAGIPTGVMSHDLDTGAIEVNPAMVRMLGYP
ncbi:MAG TPA: PAS domain-containing protein, partial [Gaiellaceae bacterium]|nr:PAS domain-containing protein [Gaiellaceae bacterium]